MRHNCCSIPSGVGCSFSVRSRFLPRDEKEMPPQRSNVRGPTTEIEVPLQ